MVEMNGKPPLTSSPFCVILQPRRQRKNFAAARLSFFCLYTALRSLHKIWERTVQRLDLLLMLFFQSIPVGSKSSTTRLKLLNVIHTAFVTLISSSHLSFFCLSLLSLYTPKMVLNLFGCC